MDLGNGTLGRQFTSFEEAKKFFREQIKKLHPDKGGDPQEFLTLLERYQEFLRDYGKKREVKVVKNIPLRGNYFFAVLDLTVEEVALGCNKKVKIPGEEVVCPSCNGTGKKVDGKSEECGFCRGTGFIEVESSGRKSYLSCPYCKGYGYILKDYCDECKGKGKVRIQKEVEVKLPLGIKQGDIIFVSRAYADTPYDLYFEINILPHPYFSIEEDRLIYHCRIPFWEVMLKEEITIQTLEGEEKLPTSRFLSGSPILIKGRGPFINEHERGDLLVKFELFVPERIPEKAKSLIAKAVEIIKREA